MGAGPTENAKRFSWYNLLSSVSQPQFDESITLHHIYTIAYNVYKYMKKTFRGNRNESNLQPWAQQNAHSSTVRTTQRCQLRKSSRLKILSRLEQPGSMRATAKQFSTSGTEIQPSQIRCWKKESGELQSTVLRNPHATTVHARPTVQDFSVRQKFTIGYYSNGKQELQYLHKK